MTTPTANPVPSNNPNDLLFNAEQFDVALNSTAASYTDRLGVVRRTVKGQFDAVDAELAEKLDDAQSQINIKVNEASGYADDAADSALEALGYLQTYRTTSYGAYASDPATDPLGNPPTVGDEYFNTTSNLLKRFNGTTWQASDINTANLAAPSGSSLVGFQPAGTGAVANTVGNILRLKVSVFNFMTPEQIADVQSYSYSIDVSAAVQAADLATRGKQKLEFPPGGYFYASKVYVGRGSKWVGENEVLPDYRTVNQNVTKFKFAAGISGIEVDQSDFEFGYVWGIALKNIFIEGGSRTTSPIGLLLRNVANSRFENLGITNFDVGLKITNGMFNTFNSVASQRCGTTALLMTDEDGVTTTQRFVDCIFRESDWGIQMHTSGSYLLGTVFDHCTVESTKLGGCSIHKGVHVTFIEPYFENVTDYTQFGSGGNQSGAAIRLYFDGSSSNATTYSVCNIFGGDIAGPNIGSGLLNTLVDVGPGAAAVNIYSTAFKRGLHGVKVDPAVGNSVVNADNPSFVSVINQYTGTAAQRRGLWPNGVIGFGPAIINYSGYFGSAIRTDGDKIEIRNSGNTQFYTEHSAASTTLHEVNAIGSGGASVSYRIRIQNAGAQQEVARFNSAGYSKFTSTGSFAVPNYIAGASDASHQFVANGDVAALLVSNLGSSSNAHVIRTTKPDITNGYHFLASRTDTLASVFRVAANGDVSNTNNIYGAISDIKLKKDIIDASSQWEDIKALRVRKYRLRDDPDGALQLGLIAQEAEAISPGLIEETHDVELVDVKYTDENGDLKNRFDTRETGEITKSVKYSVLYMKAVKALQEAMERIEVLEADVQALKQ